METRSLVPLEPGERAIDGGRPLASRTTAREERAFDDEVERAAERAGGADAREQRSAECHAERRAERRAGFRESASPEERSSGAPGDGSDADARLASGAGGPAQAPERPFVADRDGASAPAIRSGTDAIARSNAPEAQAAAVGAGDDGSRAAPSAGFGPAAGPGATGVVSSSAGTSGVAAAGAAAGASPTGAGEAVALSEPGSRATRDAAAIAKTEEARSAPGPSLEDAQDVLRQIRLRVVPGVSEASLTLVPAHLGRLQIKLQIAGGKVGAVVRAESQETLDLLERHLPELREALGREGLDAGDIRLELGLDHRHGRERADAEGAAGGARARSGDGSSDHAALDARLAHLIQRLSPTEGGVDTYA